MIKIIAITNDGGMEIGKEYLVGAGVAAILVNAKRAKYPTTEVTEEPIQKPKKTKRK